MKIHLDEKGAISIWSTLLIMTFIVIFFMLFSLLQRQSLKNEMIRRVDLSSKWILSHYNEPLLKAYGIMGYSHEWLNKEGVIDYNLESSECMIKQLNHLGQTETFVEQATTCATLDLTELVVRNSMNAADTLKNTQTSTTQTSPSDEWEFEKENDVGGLSEEEIKRARRISGQVKKNKKNNTFDLSEGQEVQSKVEMPDIYLNRIEKRIQKKMKPLETIRAAAFHEYLISRFEAYVKDKRSESNVKTTLNGMNPFKNCEIEFILHGKKNIQTNQLLTWGEILTLRVGINTTHLLFCGAHQKQISTMAALTCAVFPIAQPAAYVGILGAWASMESLEDLKHLKRGHAIPSVKITDEEWLTDFEDTLIQKKSYENLSPINASYYSDYLRILLWLRPTEEKAARAMTLIEWNMSINNGSDFSLDDWISRHTMTVKWRGMTWELEDGY